MSFVLTAAIALGDLDDDESVAVIAIVDHLEQLGRRQMRRRVRRPRRLNLNNICDRKFWKFFYILKDLVDLSHLFRISVPELSLVFNATS